MTRRSFLAASAAFLAAREAEAATRRKVICLGDSLTVGYTVPGGGQQAQNYPALLNALIPGSVVVNYGYSGHFIGPWPDHTPSPSTMVSLIGTASVTPAIPSVTSILSATMPNVVVLWGGSNDIAQEHERTGADGYQTGGFSAACFALRALGCRVVACTVIAREFAFNFAACETQRLAFNTYIRNASAEYDVLVDLAATFNDFDNATYYYADEEFHTHVTPAANAIIAGLVRGAVGYGGSISPMPGTVG